MLVYEKIKKRLKDNNVRHYSCDNVSAYIEPGEKDQLVLEVTDAFKVVIERLLIDQDNDPNSQDTARRLAKMYLNELFEGRFDPEPNATAFPNEGDDAYHGMLVVRADIKSVCSHHWQPVLGTAFIGILPSESVLGLSKYIRIAQHMARRGTLQEELTTRIMRSIIKKTGSEDVGVYIQATHGCVSCRGVNQANSLTQTISLSGAFKDEIKVKEEFYNNIKIQQNV